MRQFIISILVSAISLLSCQDLMQFVLFKINQETIAAKFCVNKKEKTYTCHGKCHLSKIIAQSKDTDSSDVPMPMLETERLSFVYLITQEKSHTFDLTPNLHKPFHVDSEPINSSHLFDLLRPPIG